MADLDNLQQAERDRRAELRAALLAGEDTAAIRAEIGRIKARITRATRRNEEDEREYQRQRDASIRRNAHRMANDMWAAIDARLSALEAPAPISHEGL